jgi:TonB family protein
MTLTIKDSLELTNPGKAASPSQAENKAGESPRSKPVCLEVSVTVRSLPGENGDAPGSTGPIREEARTAIVFDNGAVLRLSNNLSAGQQVILSNAQGREVVCRVVNGRNLPIVKGYIEVEFMEPISDFWPIHQGAEPVFVSPPPVPAPEGSAPSFEDIAGLVRMSPLPAARVNAGAPTAQLGALKGKNEARTSQSEPEFLSTISTPNPTNMPRVNGAILAAHEFSSLPVQKPSPSNVLMAPGMFASDQITPGSSPSEVRRRAPLIIGGAALLLVGFGCGYFYMHQGSAPAPATSAALATQPSAPVLSARSNEAKQVPVPQTAAEQQPSQPKRVSADSSLTPEAGATAFSEGQQNLRRAAADGKAKQPDRGSKQHQKIPSLKMISPSAPRQDLAKHSVGSAPSITDVSSGVAVGGASSAAMLAPVMRFENQPAPPSSLISSAPSGRSVREPKLISSTHPVYPSIAKQSNTQGTVVVSAEVDAKGNVTGVKAISGVVTLRQAATDAVRQWKYSPALIDGKPASSQVTIDVQFRLN